MKQPSLSSLLKKAKFSWVNNDITPAHFPYEELRGEVKIYHFHETIESEEAIRRMEQEGYVPANIFELIDWHIKNPKNKDFVIALGSVWRSSDGYRRVPCLDGGASKRLLCLYWFDGRWNSDCRFAAVRKYQKLETKNLGSDLESLTLRISSLEQDMEKLKKIINP